MTSPDPELNGEARNYFTRHMRILEDTMSTWPLPDMLKQIDAVREAFSVDTRKPFVLKPGIASLLSARTRSPERPGKRDKEIPVPGSSRPKLSTRASTTRATSPAPSQASSYGFAKEGDGPKSRTRGGSTASGPDIGRSSLWQELRDMQLRSRPFSDRARSIEPP